MDKRISHTLFIIIFVLGCLEVSAKQQPTIASLTYNIQIQGPVPIPPAERNLQQVIAKPWFKVSSESHVLEGAIFDRNGNLLFCDVTGRRVLKLTPHKQLSTVVTLTDFSPGGLALHKDGRLFIAALNLNKGLGTIIAVNTDGSNMQTIIPVTAGYLPNDLVFDAHNGFYFTDFKGTATEPKGGVYYTSPDLKTITPVIPNLAQANGIALSPDGKSLWTTEFGRNLLHRIELASPTTITPVGSAIIYHFTGPAPDSMRIDNDSNLYVAINSQGRILVFNKNGIPIGQILLPGRNQGHNLQSTSLAIHPQTNDLYSVSNDESGEQGATIFHAKVFTHGLQPN